jgi:hypothetical protein
VCVPGVSTVAGAHGKERLKIGAKKRQTMGKMIRERERAEKRARKQEKKDEKKAAALAAAEGGVVTDLEAPPADEETSVSAEQ